MTLETSSPAPSRSARTEALRPFRQRLHRMAERFERLRALASSDGHRGLARAFGRAAETAVEAQARITDCIVAEGGWPRALSTAEDLDSTIRRASGPHALVALADAWLSQDSQALADLIDAPLNWSKERRAVLVDIDLALEETRHSISSAAENIDGVDRG